MTVPAPDIRLSSPFPTNADRTAGTFNPTVAEWANTSRQMAADTDAAGKAVQANAAFTQQTAEQAQIDIADAVAAGRQQIAIDANQAVDQARTHANSARVSAQDAGMHALNAAAASHFAGIFSELSGSLSVPATVKHADRFWVLVGNVAQVQDHEPGVSGAWSLLGAVSAPVRRPVNVSPLPGAEISTPVPTLTIGSYHSLYGVAQGGVRFRVSKHPEFAVAAYESGWLPAGYSHQVPNDTLEPLTVYFWQAQSRDIEGAESEWSLATDFETLDIREVATPSIVSPVNAATGIRPPLTLTFSAFASTAAAMHKSSRYQISATPDFAVVLWDSGVLGAVTSASVPASVLSTGTTYYARACYESSLDNWSFWSEPSQFTTAATFNSYIPTPAPTPANFGGPLEGGFYAGMIWNQVVQSVTSMTLGVGAKVFTVPEMASAPIVYEGQQLEIRSRSNPQNHFKCTVTGASGTQLSVNVTSISGSGTFSNWSVMSRYRVIVAPKASGENAGIVLKNDNSALPTACQTLTEGLRATQAMVAAGTSTVYPAAYWARNLNIGGRTDWYIPARDELELCWRNLKPTTTANSAVANRATTASFSYVNNGSYGDTANTHGTNNNSSPTGAAYTSSVPGQTAATAFRTGGAEAYEFGSAYYWSSSDFIDTSAWLQYWYSYSTGDQSSSGKSAPMRVRAVRRSII